MDERLRTSLEGDGTDGAGHAAIIRGITELENMMTRLESIKARVEELEQQHSIKEDSTPVAVTPKKVFTAGFAVASLISGQVPKV